MATTINLVKELAEADTPLLFFQCVLPSIDGAAPEVEYWCTHAVSFNGKTYSARVLKHNLFDLQLSADDAMDGVTQLSITLADADAALAQLNSNYGFKGSQLTVYFAFADLPTGTITTESTVLFNGVAGDPDEITEDSLTLTFTNKLSLQRIPIPEVRVQRSCPWNFPATLQQRTQAADQGALNRYSPFYRCGYSADVPGGVGNLAPDGQAYTTCSKSRSDCLARGMFNIDMSNRETARFGGFEFVPSTYTVRTSGSTSTHLSPLVDNLALYNDPVPIVYGQGWLKAPVVFSRNDGNLTHMEVLLGMGQIGYLNAGTSFDGVLKVVVNDIEIPKGSTSGQDLTTTGWYNVFTTGTRNGGFNNDFSSNGQPLGDPYGSMAALSVVVPSRICSGTSLANVEVLLQGIQVDSYNNDGSYNETAWSDNPAWIILDLLKRSGWTVQDINLSSFFTSAVYCAALISATDANGNPTNPVARYKCNLILTKRQSAAVLVRGIRVASSLMLRYGTQGLLELLPEQAAPGQQPNLPDGGNSTEPFSNGGWPAYEFSDGCLPPFSGIVRNPNGTSTLRFSSRSVAETSNRLSVEFQDEWNEYQQDSFSVVDADDSALVGNEISSQSTALGIANFSQAERVLLQQLDKAVDGNLFIEFQTSFRGLKIRPGDIIAVSSTRPILAGSAGNYRIPFRVVKLSPSMNYQLVTIVAQIHDDDWYSDDVAVLGGPGRQPSSQVQTPLPLIGLVEHDSPTTDAFEYFDFKVSEALQSSSAGTSSDLLTVGFSVPNKPSASSTGLPIVALSSQIDSTGGTLPSSNFYYAVSALDSFNNEGALSFSVLVEITTGTNTNAVTITGLSFPSGAASFNVYRGITPQTLYRIASGIQIAGVSGQPVSSYLDTGVQATPIGPPDANFDHANFYWRYEYSSAYTAAVFTSNTIGVGSQTSWAAPGVYAGKVVRIIEGTGAGQELSIINNDNTTLTVSPGWSVIPDVTSVFVVSEASWRFAAVSANSPAQFEVPYSVGDAIQITGRAANVNNQEGLADLCPLTRVTLGQQSTDGGLPPLPSFVVATPGGGDVTLSQIGFGTEGNSLPPNIESISTGTLQLFYWNELDTPSSYALSAPLDAVTTTFSPGAVISPPPSYYVQIGSEIMTVVSVDTATNSYTVERAELGSTAEPHNAGDAVLHLSRSFVVVPFSPGFFGNSASIDYLHTFSLPDARISAADFFVTNAFGDSPTALKCSATDSNYGGLRTLSGGQFSLQVSGYLATQQNAAPPLLIGNGSHAVRDLRATVSQAPSGYNISVDVLQNGTLYCNLTIGSGNTQSGPQDANGVFSAPAITNGAYLPPLLQDASLSINVTLQPVATTTTALNPGRDLTVTIRL